MKITKNKFQPTSNQGKDILALKGRILYGRKYKILYGVAGVSWILTYMYLEIFRPQTLIVILVGRAIAVIPLMI